MGLLARRAVLAASLCTATLFGAPAFWATDVLPHAIDTATGWRPLGPDYANVSALAADPFDDSYLVAGTFYGGAYRSEDSGLNWTHLESPFSTMYVLAVAFDPGQRGTFYVGTYQGGIYRTSDYGRTWTARNGGLTDLDIRAVAVDPFDSRFLVAAGAQGVYVRRDESDWQPIDAPILANAIVFDPVRRGTICLGTVQNAVVRSTDGGRTWTPYGEGMNEATVLSLAFSADGRVLYAGTYTGAYRRTVDQPGWQDISFDLPAKKINQLWPDRSSHRVLAATDGGVFQRPDDDTPGIGWSIMGYFACRSLLPIPTGAGLIAATLDRCLLVTFDAGQSWRPWGRGLQNAFIPAIISFQRSESAGLLAGSEAGVFSLSVPLHLYGMVDLPPWNNPLNFIETVVELALHPREPQTLFAGTERSGLWKSRDSGISWSRSSRGIVPPLIRSLSQSPLPTHTLYAGTLAGLFTSRDNGQTWIPATQVPIAMVSSVATDRLWPGIAYLATSDGTIYRTKDDGGTFIRVREGDPLDPVMEVKAVSVYGFYAVVYAITSKGKMFASADDGLQWHKIAPESESRILCVDVDLSNPRVSYIGTSGSGVFRSSSGGVTWSAKSSGMKSGYVFSLAVDPHQAGTIYAATGDGVYKSTDEAESWSRASTGLPAGAISRLVCDPVTAGLLYVVVEKTGVFRSLNGGATWIPSDSGLPAAEVMSLACDPSAPLRLYAGTASQGVFSSTDGGATWFDSSEGMSMMVRGIVIDPTNPEVMYAGTLIGGIFKSTDGGQSWRNAGLRNSVLLKLIVDPRNPRTLYAGTGIARTLDGGATWAMLGQRSSFILAMEKDPRDPRILYIGTASGGIFRSRDDGQSWEELSVGLPAKSVIAIAVDELSGAIYASLESLGVYRSVDEGSSWDLVLDSDWLACDVAALEVIQTPGTLRPDGATTVLAASRGSGILTSPDRGGTWSFHCSGFTTCRMLDVVADPASPGTLYASDEDGGISKSDDGGVTWRPAGAGIVGRAVYRIVPDRRNAGILFAATDQGVFKSTDSAATWQRSDTGLASPIVRTIWIDEFTDHALYVGTAGDGIYRSTDDGQTWLSASQGLYSGQITALCQGATPGVVFAGTLGSGVERSSDGGVSWSGGSRGLATPFVLTLAVDPATSSTLYAGTGGFGMLKSTNAGVDWIPINDGLDDPDVFSIAIISATKARPLPDPEAIFVGTRRHGVFVSNDGGHKWTPLTRKGLFNPFVLSLVIDAVHGKAIYAGTEGGGIFMLPVDSATGRYPVVRNPPAANGPPNPIQHRDERRQSPDPRPDGAPGPAPIALIIGKREGGGLPRGLEANPWAAVPHDGVIGEKVHLGIC